MLYVCDCVFSVKRQMADAKASEYLALIRLGLASGCREIGCGLIDFHTRYNKMYVLFRPSNVTSSEVVYMME